MQNKILEIKKLSKSFAHNGGQLHILSNLDLDIYENDFTVIMGSSGSGKSTLLYAISGMDKATSGSVLYKGLDINTLKERISNDKINIRPMFKTKTVDELYNERIDKYNLFKDYTVKNINVVDAVKEIKEVLGL